MSIYWIPFFPLFGAAINLIGGRRISHKAAHSIAIGALIASFFVTIVVFLQLLDVHKSGDDGLNDVLFSWFDLETLHITWGFTFDSLSAISCLTITFVSSLIHWYSMAYMKGDLRYVTYFGYLNLFTGAMLILVLADNLIMMFVGWEGVGLCSYLLIGFWFENRANTHAAKKAFIMNRIGDCLFLLGMFLLFSKTGTLIFSELADNPHLLSTSDATLIGLLLFGGVCAKSAQIPLHTWLPDAMAGPTPVSALIHAATMVTAGVYFIARLSSVFGTETLMIVVTIVGAITILVGAFAAMGQQDIKKVLAYSTISQLGFMCVAVGMGALSAGVFHMVTHAFFKAGLFLCAGSVLHAMKGNGDIRQMGGLRTKLPQTHITFVICALALCGIFPFAGFWSKEDILLSVWDVPQWKNYSVFLWAILSVGSVCTSIYMARLYFLIFSGTCRASTQIQKNIHEAPKTMTIPALILAGVSMSTIVVGLPHLELIPIPTYFADFLSISSPNYTTVSRDSIDSFVFMMLALILSIGGIALSTLIYGDNVCGDKSYSNKTVQKTFQKAFQQPSGWLLKCRAACLDGFYLDRVYQSLIVRPVSVFSGFLYNVVDRFIIDTIIVHGIAEIVRHTGQMLRFVHNGSFHRYVAVLIIGSALILYMVSS